MRLEPSGLLSARRFTPPPRATGRPFFHPARSRRFSSPPGKYRRCKDLIAYGHYEPFPCRDIPIHSRARQTWLVPQVDLVIVVALALVGFAALFQGARVKLRVPTAMVCFSIGGWVAASSLHGGDGTPTYAGLALLFGSVALTAGWSYILMRKLLENDVEIPFPHLIVILAFPVIIMVVTLFGIGIPQLDNWRLSPTYIVQAIYIYGHFGAMGLVMAKRQGDPSRRIRYSLRAATALLVTGVIVETLAYQYTAYVAVLLAFFGAWAARWPAAWWQAPVDADELLESIGVFLFVIDDEGRLSKWNTTAANLVEALAPRTKLQRGLYVEKLLGISLPLRDGAVVEFELGGGVLRTECNTHEIPVGTDSSTTERVLMMRPLKSRVASSRLATPSGELPGYDPVTQTLSRRSILERLETAEAAIRLEFRPTIKAVLVDEVMFVVARRLESAFGGIEWGRVDPWAFVAVVSSREEAQALANALLSIDGVPIEYGLAVYSQAFVEHKYARESGSAFALRVAQPRMNETVDPKEQEFNA